MRQQIDVSEMTDEEGAGKAYSLDRAREEGLYEEVILDWGDEAEYLGTVDVDPSDTLMDICHKLELGVNVGTGDEQVLYLRLKYHYGYGQVPK